MARSLDRVFTGENMGCACCAIVRQACASASATRFSRYCRRVIRRVLIIALPLFALACGDDAAPAEDAPPAPATSPTQTTTGAPSASASSTAEPPAPPTPLALHFVYVNGLSDPDHYANAGGSLKGLSNAVAADVKAKAPAFEAAHNVKISTTATFANVYTNLDGSVPDPGTDDGTGQQVANKWRSQLVAKLKQAFPNGEKNIILVGHSTGGRAAMEVTADVGPDNKVGSANYGFKDRVAGVVTVHGMLDALSEYPTSAVISFELGCSAAKKPGWCGYAANISSWPAADWVATNRRSLVMTGSFDDCGFPIWGEQSDNALPLRAQGSPASVGLGLAKLSSGAYGASHGVYYGDFCHSDITNAGPRHATAITNATSNISKWLFESAPVVVNDKENDQRMTSPSIAGGTRSVLRPIEAPCPTLWEPTDRPIDLVGNCSHPGLTDGDDHAMTAAQLFSTSNGECGGSVQWKNVHDDAHAGTVWFKAYAQPSKDAGVLGSLLP